MYPAIDSYNKPLKEKHIDITVTASNGCTIHVVGTLNYNIIPPRVNGFTGTVTIGGPAHCPHTMLTINWAAKNSNNKGARLNFDSEDVCKINKVTWFPEDKSYTEILNDENLNAAFVRELKSADCNDDQ